MSSSVMTRDDLDHMRLFQTARLSKLKDDAMLISPGKEAGLILHVFPLQSIVDRKFLDVVAEKEIFERTDHYLSYRPNVDGYFGHNDQLGRWQQIFRTGIIERIEVFKRFNGENKIPVGVLEGEIARAMSSFVPVFQALGLQPPIYIFLSLIHVKDWKLVGCDAGNYADRDDLLLPETAVFSWPDNWKSALRPLFEILWNAFGLERRACLDETGNTFDPDA